ncbi:MAG: hypothetical protein VXY78_00185 [Pseudomonadota bacterium]|jgi:hypothetical protein|nr:hypothetical protein [Pseudomonadota bacterium]MEC9085979.1 hypothetical protein [Pseudomonadota bacterium]
MSEGALFDRSSLNLEGAIQAWAQLHFAYLFGLQFRVSFQVSAADVERRMFRRFLNAVACAWFYLGVGEAIFRLSRQRAQNARLQNWVRVCGIDD